MNSNFCLILLIFKCKIEMLKHAEFGPGFASTSPHINNNICMIIAINRILSIYFDRKLVVWRKVFLSLSNVEGKMDTNLAKAHVSLSMVVKQLGGHAYGLLDHYPSGNLPKTFLANMVANRIFLKQLPASAPSWFPKFSKQCKSVQNQCLFTYWYEHSKNLAG